MSTFGSSAVRVDFLQTHTAHAFQGSLLFAWARFSMLTVSVPLSAIGPVHMEEKLMKLSLLFLCLSLPVMGYASSDLSRTCPTQISSSEQKGCVCTSEDIAEIRSLPTDVVVMGKHVSELRSRVERGAIDLNELKKVNVVAKGRNVVLSLMDIAVRSATRTGAPASPNDQVYICDGKEGVRDIEAAVQEVELLASRIDPNLSSYSWVGKLAYSHDHTATDAVCWLVANVQPKSYLPRVVSALKAMVDRGGKITDGKNPSEAEHCRSLL